MACPLISNIPHMEGLKILCCSSCPLINNIPVIKGLKELYCSDFPLIKHISLRVTPQRSKTNY